MSKTTAHEIYLRMKADLNLYRTTLKIELSEMLEENFKQHKQHGTDVEVALEIEREWLLGHVLQNTATWSGGHSLQNATEQINREVASELLTGSGARAVRKIANGVYNG